MRDYILLSSWNEHLIQNGGEGEDILRAVPRVHGVNRAHDRLGPDILIEVRLAYPFGLFECLFGGYMPGFAVQYPAGRFADQLRQDSL